MQRRLLLGTLAALGPSSAFALYDPPPNDLLRHLPGRWRGSLTYRDGRPPWRRVTLPCVVMTTLASPQSLSLYFVFDDGPGKTVYSYDLWTLDLAQRRFAWASGANRTDYELASAAEADGAARFTFTRPVDGKTQRLTLQSTASAWELAKDEIGPDGVPVFANRYEFRRADAPDGGATEPR